MRVTSTDPGHLPTRIGVVGTGALGRQHVRILSQLPEAELVGVFDIRPDAARDVSEEFGARTWSDLDSLASEIDAAVIAVPTTEHVTVGRSLVSKGIDVLVEKPLATTVEEADELLAAAADRVVAVGHVEFYNPAVQAMLDASLVPGFVEVQRMSKFTPRSLDIDVVLDLMIHDLQILHAMDASPVKEIRATGVRVLSDRLDITNARVELESGCVANVTASRVSSTKIRKLRVFAQSSYYSLDYEAQEIQGYRLVSAPEGDRRIEPHPLEVVKDEPLKRELESFLAACRGDEVRFVDGSEGRRALETAHEILAAV